MQTYFKFYFGNNASYLFVYIFDTIKLFPMRQRPLCFASGRVEMIWESVFFLPIKYFFFAIFC